VIPKAKYEGILTIGDMEIPCAVLDNGMRVLTQSGVMLALGRARQAKGRQYYDADVNLPAFLTAKNLKPFIPDELTKTSSQIDFKTLGTGARAFGYQAELLPKDVHSRIEATLNLETEMNWLILIAAILCEVIGFLLFLQSIVIATRFQGFLRWTIAGCGMMVLLFACIAAMKIGAYLPWGFRRGRN